MRIPRAATNLYIPLDTIQRWNFFLTFPWYELFIPAYSGRKDNQNSTY